MKLKTAEIHHNPDFAALCNEFNATPVMNPRRKHRSTPNNEHPPPKTHPAPQTKNETALKRFRSYTFII